MRAPTGPRRASQEHRHADLRRLRRAAADRQARRRRRRCITSCPATPPRSPAPRRASPSRRRRSRPASARRSCRAIPSVYGNLLRDLIAKHHVDCWLVNTGWTGGEYGTGRRMPIRVDAPPAGGRARRLAERAPISAPIPYFGFAVPTSVPGVEPHILYPVKTWQDKAAFAAVGKAAGRDVQRELQAVRGPCGCGRARRRAAILARRLTLRRFPCLLPSARRRR